VRIHHLRSPSATLLVVAAAAIAGCGSAPASLAPSAAASAADATTLHEVLALWSAFPVNASPRPLILLGGDQQTVGSSNFGFSSADAKFAYQDGQIRPPATWPVSPGQADGYPLIAAAQAFTEFAPPAGAQFPTTSTWLQATSVQLGAASFDSDRGPVELPAWVFTLDQASGSVAVLALTPASVYATPTPLHSSLEWPLAGGAQLAGDGRTLTVATGGPEAGTGPCEATYSLRVAESDTAVAIVVDERMNPPPANEACPVQEYSVQLAAVLTAPLGARVVANADADAIAVTGDGRAG
jgi:hypothetical protein